MKTRFWLWLAGNMRMRQFTSYFLALLVFAFYACGDTPFAPTPPAAFIRVVTPLAGASFGADSLIKIMWHTNHSGPFDVWIIRVDAAADLHQKAFESVPAGDIIWRNWKESQLPPGNYVIRVEALVHSGEAPVASGDSGVFSLIGPHV